MEQNIITASKPIKIPGPDHPITIERNPARIMVSVAGRIVALMQCRQDRARHRAQKGRGHFVPLLRAFAFEDAAFASGMTLASGAAAGASTSCE